MAGVGDHDTIYPPVGYRWPPDDETSLYQTIDRAHHGRVGNRDRVGELGLRRGRTNLRHCRERHPTGRTQAHIFEAAIHCMPPTSRKVVQRAFKSRSRVGYVLWTFNHSISLLVQMPRWRAGSLTRRRSGHGRRRRRWGRLLVSRLFFVCARWRFKDTPRQQIMDHIQDANEPEGCEPNPQCA
jgi:hypothetical protein